MARPKKDGRRATGIQGKKGYLYIVTSQPVIRDGAKKIEKRWSDRYSRKCQKGIRFKIKASW